MSWPPAYGGLPPYQPFPRREIFHQSGYPVAEQSPQRGKPDASEANGNMESRRHDDSNFEGFARSMEPHTFEGRFNALVYHPPDPLNIPNAFQSHVAADTNAATNDPFQTEAPHAFQRPTVAYQPARVSLPPQLQQYVGEPLEALVRALGEPASIDSQPYHPQTFEHDRLQQSIKTAPLQTPDRLGAEDDTLVDDSSGALTMGYSEEPEENDQTNDEEEGSSDIEVGFFAELPPEIELTYEHKPPISRTMPLAPGPCYVKDDPSTPADIFCRSDSAIGGLRVAYTLNKLDTNKYSSAIESFLVSTFGPQLELRPIQLQKYVRPRHFPPIQAHPHVVNIARYGESPTHLSIDRRQFHCVVQTKGIAGKALPAPVYKVQKPIRPLFAADGRPGMIDEQWLLKCGTCNRTYVITVYL